MRITVNGVDCEYEAFNAGDARDTVVFLHGWGGDINSFRGSYNAACEWGVNCLNVAIPPVVPESFGVYDYAALITSLLEKLGIRNPIIVGHSFGGRLAIILAAQGRCKRVMLVDSAGVKPRFSLKKRIRIARYKRAKKRGKTLDGYGSIDYNNLDESMRRVFVRIVNTHLDRLLKNITCRTFIFWGKDDRDTPPYMAKRLHKKIKNSELYFADGGHYSYVDAQIKFNAYLKSFVTE
ncbi:MAG: alpha/beta hydrolase [Clostridiales bacterium]|nr:alpha/beta hydrolase [Clostridiales bacterium]